MQSEGLGTPDIISEVIAHHQGPSRRGGQRGQCRTVAIGMRFHPSGVGGHHDGIEVAAQAEALEGRPDHRAMRIVGYDTEPAGPCQGLQNFGGEIEQPRTKHDFAPERIRHAAQPGTIRHPLDSGKGQGQREAIVERVLALGPLRLGDLAAAGRVVILDEHADRQLRAFLFQLRADVGRINALDAGQMTVGVVDHPRNPHQSFAPIEQHDRTTVVFPLSRHAAAIASSTSARAAAL